MCLMSSVRWRDWIGKATERSSETTQREVDDVLPLGRDLGGGHPQYGAPNAAAVSLASLAQANSQSDSSALTPTLLEWHADWLSDPLSIEGVDPLFALLFQFQHKIVYIGLFNTRLCHCRQQQMWWELSL